MKVLVGPRLDVAVEARAAAMCRRLAGDEGIVVSLHALGLKNPYRPLSPAEVALLRTELREAVSDGGGVVGYVCRGVPAPGRAAGWVAVTDHVNLTWRSPLTGPNDEEVGPRFPAMDGVYATEAAMALGGGEDGMIVVPGVVAGVPRDLAMGDYEVDTVVRNGWAAASSELVAPVIVAAHMRLQVAAVVMAV